MNSSENRSALVDAVQEAVSHADIAVAEATDAALSAHSCEVATGEIEAAFGREPAHLADVASGMAAGGLTRFPPPEPGYVASLEADVVAAYESRPVALRFDPLVSRFGTIPELAMAGSLAIVIAVGAFLLGATSLLDRQASAIPTANAETRTATVATPAPAATVPTGAALSTPRVKHQDSATSDHKARGPDLSIDSPTTSPRRAAIVRDDRERSASANSPLEKRRVTTRQRPLYWLELVVTAPK